jgi:hypothetical protein
MDEGAPLPSTTATEEYGTWFDHDDQSNTGYYLLPNFAVLS